MQSLTHTHTRVSAWHDTHNASPHLPNTHTSKVSYLQWMVNETVEGINAEDSLEGPHDGHLTQSDDGLAGLISRVVAVDKHQLVSMALLSKM